MGENNPARFIDTFVDSIDLHDLGFRYSFLENGAGRPSYNPHDLLKIYLWGYYNAIRSSRKLEAECNRNIEVMWLTRKLSPDFKTISDFRKDNIECIKSVFSAFNKQCLIDGLFGGKTIAIDGTKIRAWNSRDRTYRRDTVEKQIAEMDEKVEKYLSDMDENDAKEKDEPEITNMKEKIESMKKRMEKLKGIKKTLDSEKSDEVSLTDPEARLMKTRNDIVKYFTHLWTKYEINYDPCCLLPYKWQQRGYTHEEKLKIVLEGMSGTISVSDLCRKYDLRPARFYYWKDQLLNSAPEIFENRGRKIDEDRIRSEKDIEIARLKETIAEIVSENLEIKKRLERCGSKWIQL